jgi:hypothetical protein
MTEQPKPKKSVCIDLDGVLAKYDGWQGLDNIGEPREGAPEFTKRLREHYRIVIFTTRVKLDMDDRPKGETVESLRRRVGEWLDLHGFVWDEIYVGQGKPIAVAYVDDRAVAIPTNPDASDFLMAFNDVLQVAGK